MIKRGRVNRCLKPALWTADFHLNAYFSDSLAFVRKDRYSWDCKPNITALNLSIIDSYFFYFKFASASYPNIVKWIGGRMFFLCCPMLLSAYFDANMRKKYT